MLSSVTMIKQNKTTIRSATTNQQSKIGKRDTRDTIMILINNAIRSDPTTKSTTYSSSNNKNNCPEQGKQQQTLSSTNTPSSPAMSHHLHSSEEQECPSSKIHHHHHHHHHHCQGQEEKSVRFDTIKIREYPIELGQGSVPTNDGAPLGIGWKWFSERTITVVDYELENHEEEQEQQEQQEQQERHSISNNNYKKQDKLYRSNYWRKVILLDQGYSLKEIDAASMDCDKIRARRVSSSKPTTGERLFNFVTHSHHHHHHRGTRPSIIDRQTK